tara:strand:+ start:178 stop:486 length:309 start_codon:yes stop_codon:yes gene_type:complete
MKILTNNQSNKLLFINNSNINISSVVAQVVQLGSENITTIPITIDDSDCFTITFDVTLSNNQLQNATYMLRILDLDGVVLFSTTIRVDGNSEEIRSYIVLDN